MSNVTTANPWILDTAAVITTEPVRVRRMTYIPNAADNDLEVKHANGGGVIWVTRAIAAASNNESVGQEAFEGPIGCSGFNLATIDGGKLYVYLESRI
jgi:hypothetical protein